MQSTLTSYMVQNTLLALAVGITAFLWSRSDFRLPRSLRPLVRAPRTLLTLGGWLVIVIISIYSVGDLLSGSTQIADSAPHYARRATQPWLYWRQLAWQLGVGLLLGGSLLRLARRAGASVERSATRSSA